MIDGKMSLLNQLKERLTDTLTVEQMARLNSAAMNVLEHFRVDELRIAEDLPDDLLASYISALKVECRSEQTIRRYEYVISQLMDYAKVPTRLITVYHMRSFLSHEKDRGLKEGTLEGYRQVFSAYFNWLQRECLIERNPCANLGAIKTPKVEKKTYSETDIEKLDRACGSVRDQAIIHFLLSTGCRISEMTGLDRDAVDLEKLECTVHGKGNKERRVYLSEVAGMLMAEYLSSRKDDEPALFIGVRMERLQPGGVRDMLKLLARKAGVEHVHPHKFRRTRATMLTRHGMPIQEVARILGHEKIDTTMKYVVLNNEDIKASYRRYA